MSLVDGWQAKIQTDFAIEVYEDIWENCEVVENDLHGKGEHVAQILDFGDVDKIIRVGETQQPIHMAQRFRKPYYSKSDGVWKDPDFTLRYDRPVSEKAVEYHRLMSAHDSGTYAYPRRYSFGRVYNDDSRGLYELYIIDVDALIAGIKSDSIPLADERTTDEGQVFRAYSLRDIIDSGAVIHSRKLGTSPNPDCEKYTLGKRPDEVCDITNWVDYDD